MRGIMDLAAIGLFIEIAERKSFRNAGDALGMPRSTVSRRIAQLEDELGTRLLQRTTRSVEPTEAGKRYLRACGPAVAAILEAGRDLSDEPSATRGRLRLTAPVGFGEAFFGPVIRECLARHPEMAIEVVLTDRHVDLAQERFDLAFRTGTLRDTSVTAQELGRGQLQCLASRDYLDERGSPRTPRELDRHDCIVFAPLAPRGRWVFRSRGRALNVPVRARLTVDHIGLAIDAAVRGLGIVRVPGGGPGDFPDRKKLVEVLAAYAPPTRPVYAVHASGGRVRDVARVFLEIAKKHLASHGWLRS